MVTKEEWNIAHNPMTGNKDTQLAIYKKAKDAFFANGGTMTRREKSGAITFWKGPHSDALRRVAIQEAQAA